jgi:hypothetical protein
MTKVLNYTDAEAILNEGNRPVSVRLAQLLMAYGAKRRYGDRTLTAKQWGALLRRMGMKQPRIEPLQALLCACYPQPLNFDQWHDLFLQLAMIQNLGQ